MKTFDEQIRASAQRCRKADENMLDTPACPKLPSPVNRWKIATPAAAVAGLLLGGLLTWAPYADHYRISSSCLSDTIVQVVHDTIWTSVPVSLPSVEKQVPHGITEPVMREHDGKCIKEDGIDYSLFVSCVEI